MTIAPSRVARREWLSLAALLIGTGVLYLWNLSANGWANSFYSAAVQSGAISWKAFFFGSSDWSNAITVDKTPAALWPMALSARLFGLSSWSMLVPQVLLGVGSVALLWAIVRRYFGPAAGFVAGLVLAVTPVAALMFRFNNPDALLVFLMIAACWAMLRAVENGRVRWLLLCGVLVGLGFLAKQLQVLLVVPPLALTYLIAGPDGLGKRVVRLFAAGAGVVLGTGWWLLIATLWPADNRPYFGGSQHNSIIELTLGYNGLDRLGQFGSSDARSGFGPPSGGGPFGHAGITRLFDASVGGQIAWFIPAAAVLSVAGIVLCGKAARIDLRRATLLLFAFWGLVTGLVFSFMRGIFHEYYTVALAPALAGAIGAGGMMVWRRRDRMSARVILVGTVLVTAGTAWVLLARTADFVPWLRWAIAIAAVLAALGPAVGTRGRAVAVLTAAAVAVAGLAGPVAYVVQTIVHSSGGPLPKAGPDTGWPGGPPPGDGAPGAASGGRGPGGPGSPPRPGSGPVVYIVGPGPGTAPPIAGFPGASTALDARLTALLKEDADRFRWPAATVSSMGAAGYQLAANVPVMAIGGFAGGDPFPTLEQFQQFVDAGDIHYLITNDRGPGRPGRSDNEGTRITQWVRDNFPAVEIGGTTLYDLTAR
ncbi:ArnT family glycosyltransferase [Nocardia testacea]|uniref:ArnT family glycosyltransferase n=1 Tax=Nocardia testacea TaxID=248551 RepID=A0ABW7VPT4_9NOCA